MPERVFEIIGPDKVRCNSDCCNKFSFENKQGKRVCGLLLAPAKDGFVDLRTSFDGMRECITSENP